MTKLLSLAAAASLVARADAGGAVELTLDNFEKETAGKNAFVKFLAPWCGHCKSMKPAWDQLGDEYAGSSSVLIGDADCTESGEALCSKYEVKGYPTIKYFVDGDADGKDYQGGRDYDSLKAHVEENLEVKCDVNETSLCTDREKGYIEKMRGKTAAEREAQLTRLEKMKGGKMKPELKMWLVQRVRILQGLGAGGAEDGAEDGAADEF